MPDLSRPLRFHWSLSQAGNTFRRAQNTARMSGLPDFEAQLALCHQAERSEIDSMLMAIGFTRPDPMLLTTALGQQTETIRFMVACRAGLISPTAFVQQVNTVSTLIGGRICINMVGGHSPEELHYYGDYLAHDARYRRAEEFLHICRAFWNGSEPVSFEGTYYQVEKGQVATPFSAPEAASPEVFLGGNSALAASLAAAYADCLWRFPDTPELLRSKIAPVLDAGKEVGLLTALLARPTREEAHAAARALLDQFGDEARDAQRDFARKLDSEGFRANYAMAGEEGSAWKTPTLWTGAIPYLGAPAIALVGSYDDLAEALMAYKRVGISQYLFLGWPDLDEMVRFGRDLVPIIRQKEAALALDAAPHA